MKEQRFFQSEIRVLSKDKLTIEGHAAIFNSFSENLGDFREIIRPGAFATTIKTDDIRALIGHDPNKIIGRNTNGTLVLEEDARGLYIKVDVIDTTDGINLMKQIARRDIDQMSFGFEVPNREAEKWSWGNDGLRIRELIEVKLYDVSPVAYPAYRATDVHSISAEARSYFQARMKEMSPPDLAQPAPWRVKFDEERRRLNEILAT